MKTFTYLQIAKFTISVSSAEDHKVFIADGYLPFVIDKPLNNDIVIVVHPQIPASLINTENILYKAMIGSNDFWIICKYNKGYKFIIYKQEKPNEIQQIALVDEGFTKWEVYMYPQENKKTGLSELEALQYPLGPLILYYLTVNHEAIMIHASGIFDGEKGRIFSGFSGVGKSTMAQLWKNAGSILINDDRLIIRRINNQYHFFNTPMFYADEPKSALLTHLYLPYHSAENKYNLISGSRAVARLLAYCIQHGYNKAHMQHHLSFLTTLCSQLPVAELGVVPTPNIISFIKEYDV